jgi:hypothetical protein
MPIDPARCECDQNATEPEELPFECYCDGYPCPSLTERLLQLPTCDDPGKATWTLSNCDDFVVVSRTILLSSTTDYVYDTQTAALIGVRNTSDTPSACVTSGDAHPVTSQCRTCTVCGFDDACDTGASGGHEIPE